jgi:RHS repeat-associated protein
LRTITLAAALAKQTYNGNSAGTSWTLAETRYFVYDGWNLIVELKQPATGAPVPITYYAWGLDASGTLQGAGGVGGLLGIWTGLDTASPKAYCAVNDGLGNVVGLLDAHAGPMAAQNPVRFASKYVDADTGLVNFGYRYYSASLGRFINRDPQAEPGWNNLLADLGAGGGPSWNYIGKLLRVTHENRYGGKEPSLAHSTESGGGPKNSSLNSASVMDRKGNASTATASGPTGGASGGAWQPLGTIPTVISTTTRSMTSSTSACGIWAGCEVMGAVSWARAVTAAF